MSPFTTLFLVTEPDTLRSVLNTGCNDENTGNTFRSCDLGVMSPARYLCAMPVTC